MSTHSPLSLSLPDMEPVILLSLSLSLSNVEVVILLFSPCERHSYGNEVF